MRALALAAALVLPVLLGGASCPPEQTAIELCDIYALSLKTAAGFRARGQLTQEQIDKVEQVRLVVRPICTAETIPDGPTVREKLREGLANLARVNAAASE